MEISQSQSFEKKIVKSTFTLTMRYSVLLKEKPAVKYVVTMWKYYVKPIFGVSDAPKIAKQPNLYL